MIDENVPPEVPLDDLENYPKWMSPMEQPVVKGLPESSPKEQTVVVDGCSYRVVEIEQGAQLGDMVEFRAGYPYVLVNFGKLPILQSLYTEVEREAGNRDERSILAMVLEKTSFLFPIKEKERVWDFERKLGGKSVSLGLYLEAGIGFCEQTVLTVGAIIERFKKAGKLSGSPQLGVLKGDRGSHLWVEYVLPEGILYLDVMANPSLQGPESYEVFKEKTRIDLMTD
jgi:hypothetical protein